MAVTASSRDRARATGTATTGPSPGPQEDEPGSGRPEASTWASAHTSVRGAATGRLATAGGIVLPVDDEISASAEPDPSRPALRRLLVAGAVSVAAAVAMLVVGPMGAARGPWLAVLLTCWAVFGLSAW